MDAREAANAASRSARVREAARKGRITARAYRLLAVERSWRVSFLRDGKEVVRVEVDDRTGRVLTAWTGPQINWPFARGTRYPFKTQMELAMLALCVLFLLPFIDPRRPFRMLHLDLLAFVAFMASFLAFNFGNVSASVPLQYPPLIYLLARLIWIGSRGRRRPEPAVPFAGERLLLVGVVALVALRVAFNLVWGRVGDVGYAGVFGADSIHHGWALYTVHPSHLDTYGPVNYLLYLPFEAMFPFDPGWQRDSLSAAHSAAIAFDLAVVLLIASVGRRMQPGPGGRRLGLTLAYMWVACPFTFLPLALSANDAIVPAFVLAALLAIASPGLRGALLGLGAAAKFASLALLPLFAFAPERSRRNAVVCIAAGAGVFVAAFVPYIADSGFQTVWDATMGFQLSRTSPFSLWGLHPSLEPLHVLAQLVALAVIAGSALIRTGRDVVRIGALAGAVILATQMAGNYWAHTYVMWFAAPAFIAFIGTHAVATDRARPVAERGLATSD
jgi:hypothetical protein